MRLVIESGGEEMRAVGIMSAGGPDVLQVIDRSIRQVGTGEVRIAVRAAAVNPTDILLRERGSYLPAPWTPGMDAAGIIESVGRGVGRLRVGDEVMAAVSPRRKEGGAQAELVVVPARSAVAIPDGASFEQAATLPMNGLTAMLGLELLGLQRGQTLAITGSAGLLGSYVVSVAKAAGFRVIADAKPDDEQLVRSFGADVVIPRGADYVMALRAVAPDGADGLYDTAMLHDRVFGALRHDGRMVVVRGWTPTTTDRGILVKQVHVREVLSHTGWLEYLRELASTNRLKLRVAATYAPEQIAEAHRLMQAGGLRGRAVIVF
jgi:NADPH2:quinone reductase